MNTQQAREDIVPFLRANSKEELFLKIDLKLPGGGEIHIEREKGKDGEFYFMLFILAAVVIGSFLLLVSAAS